MSHDDEFHYRLPRRFGGRRPGAHEGSGLGSGQGFAAHRRLLDHPDPRRLDLRASLREPHGDWLVRLQRPRVAVPVYALVDVSASMHFGAGRRKLDVVADFAEALGRSAFRAGDPVGLAAFDATEREDLFIPARHGRGAGFAIAEALRACGAPESPQAAAATPAALARAAERLAGRCGLVFLVSDFHWPLDDLAAVLDRLAPAVIVPMPAWDPAEAEPPAGRALLELADAESGERRTLWLREPLRAAWRDGVAARRAELQSLFDAQGLQAFALGGRFDAEGLTRHFLEAQA